MSGIVGGNLGRGSGLIKAGAIDDNAVTLAKMAGLARGKLIYGDASGDPAALAVGGADEVLTHDGTDLSWAAAGGGTNTPAFFAQLSGDQTITTATFTKVTCDTEHLDTDADYDNSSNYRFTPTSSGTYVLNFGTSIDAVTAGKQIEMAIYKNGSVSTIGYWKVVSPSTTGANFAGSASIQTANGSSDYFEFFIYHNQGSDKDLQATRTFFSGFKIIV